ncbi:MAG: hypothetical protein Q8R47_01305 [Nanoarchaeota archaeon]|nr:hypothetical protein [Nanoarchaeota archaeon]
MANYLFKILQILYVLLLPISLLISHFTELYFITSILAFITAGIYVKNPEWFILRAKNNKQRAFSLVVYVILGLVFFFMYIFN